MKEEFCKKCGGILIKDKYTNTYQCEDCAEKYYFRTDFDNVIEEEDW
jgi:DNA-directed RNA polymerase subunit M/transcription elongation factor TFIIS